MGRKLVERAMHGDEEAFDALIERIGDQLHSVARSVIRARFAEGLWIDAQLDLGPAPVEQPRASSPPGVAVAHDRRL
jgi:hypothetical protein